MADILFVDQHLIALAKPSGILCQPNDTEDPSLEAQAKAWIKKKFEKPGNVFLHAIHRLDRPVSGVVLFALRDKALSRLNAASREGLFSKKYFALIEGAFLEEEGILEHDLVKEEFLARPARKGETHSKKCLLKYKTVKKFPSKTLLEIELLTGRYHQIRAQLSATGHPIWGDRKYGSSAPTEFFFLHHASLEFPHPMSGQKILIEAPFPTYWDEIILNGLPL
jgi:23S rRNA pseudouridine1911/1915/1917 synthase